jgi:diguanylate cyclase
MQDDPPRRGPASPAQRAAAAEVAPPELARETLKRLAAQKLAPTPENYRAVYRQIAGLEAEEAFPLEALRALCTGLPRGTPEQLALAQRMERAVSLSSWSALRAALAESAQALAGNELPWADLLIDLLRELEPDRAGARRSARAEQLLQLLGEPMPSSQLHRRLDACLREWRRQPDSSPAASAQAAAADGLPQLLGRLLADGIAPRLSGQPRLARDAQRLSEQLLRGKLPAEAELARQLTRLTRGLQIESDTASGLQEALLDLLRLILDNIRLLVTDDHWLHGQLGLLSEALEGGLDLRRLEAVARRLRKVIEKQSHLTRQIADAQQRLKALLGGFIERLTAISDSTGDYHQVLSVCAQRIERASHIEELGDVVAHLLASTEAAREAASRSAQELAELREQVAAAGQRVVVLERELQETSELVRMDPLTGALNRKGLDEALEREIARMQRSGGRLCIAVLDVDDFKQINDSHGHLVGDEVLRHIATVLRETLRGNDLVVRYGGEEFVLLLPGIGSEEARAVVSRLQRELTRRFFLANQQKLLLTFSAGIADFSADEEPAAVIERADRAMYAAKHARKNRVVVA